MVDQALLMVRQLASRPPNVFDPYALIGALEHLEDVGRRAGHADPPSKRQCCQRYLVPDWEIVPDFNLMVAAASFHERVVRWITSPGTAERASVPDNVCNVVEEPPYVASEMGA
ncbi:hypothetical protein ACROYT_G022991 [Oculina patagonica]